MLYGWETALGSRKQIEFSKIWFVISGVVGGKLGFAIYLNS